MMNRMLGLTAIVGALGIWAGVSAWQSPWVLTNAFAGVAIVIATSLLVALWTWYRAAPGSSDAVFMPTLIAGQASMLVGFLLPRLLWPDAVWLQLAGSLAYLIGAIVYAIRQIRRQRALRRAARPV
jgi:hypothetical protein